MAECVTLQKNLTMMKKTLLFMLASLSAMGVQAQLNQNPDKFLGNITTSYQIDYGNEKFYQLWDQITPENESKWDQIEGQTRGVFNWNNVDRINAYASGHCRRHESAMGQSAQGPLHRRWKESHEAIVVPCCPV